jgi:hypothetical protein
MATYDEIARTVTNDLGGGAGYTAGSAPATGLNPAPCLYVRVPYTAGAGTSADVSFVVGQKLRLVDAMLISITGVGSSTMQVFTAASGGGTAATSAMATSTSGALVRNAQVAATSVFASGATVYCHLAGGATLPGGELYLTFLPEQ